MIDYYSLLGVPFNATQQKIKEAYRKKAKTAHPDRGGSEKEFILLQNAFQTLYDEGKRKLYDEEYVAYYEELLKSSKTSNETHSSSYTTSNDENENDNEPFEETQEYSDKKEQNPFRKIIFYFSFVIFVFSIFYFTFLDNLLIDRVHDKYSSLFKYVESLSDNSNNLDEDDLNALTEAKKLTDDAVLNYRTIAGFSIIISLIMLLFNLSLLKKKMFISLKIVVSIFTLINLLLAASGMIQNYQITKWVCFIAGLFLLYNLVRRKPTSEIFYGIYILIYGSMIVLFNPFVLIHMNKNLWTFIDLFIFLFIILEIFLLNVGLKSSYTSSNARSEKM